jgi:hypothetical protein
MGFWCSLLVEVLGGVVTAALLALLAAVLAREVRTRANAGRAADLNEDARRWIRDRDLALTIALRGKVTEMAAQNQLYSGALPRQLALLKQQALHQYRDEISHKRRQYRDLCNDQGGPLARLLRLSAPLPPFRLSDEARKTVEQWRADATVLAARSSHPVNDPTSEALEPELRKWEMIGDRCDGRVA